MIFLKHQVFVKSQCNQILSTRIRFKITKSIDKFTRNLTEYFIFTSSNLNQPGMSFDSRKCEETPVPDWSMMGMMLTEGRLVGLGNIARDDLPAALDERQGIFYYRK